MDKTRQPFGRNLHYLIRANGKGLREFAREVDLDYSLLKRYVQGTVQPRTMRLKKIADALGVSPGSLLFDELVPEQVEQ